MLPGLVRFVVTSSTWPVLRYMGLCGTLTAEVQWTYTQGLVAWTGSGQLAAWVCYTGRPRYYIALGLIVCKTGEGAGTLGWSILSAGVSPRPGPRRWTMPAHCACPIDSGCSGTLPWVPSMGSLRAGGISLMGRQELLWLQTLVQRAQNKHYNRSMLAIYTNRKMRVWGERTKRVKRVRRWKERRIGLIIST